MNFLRLRTPFVYRTNCRFKMLFICIPFLIGNDIRLVTRFKGRKFLFSDNLLYLRSRERKYASKGSITDTDIENKRKRPSPEEYRSTKRCRRSDQCDPEVYDGNCNDSQVLAPTQNLPSHEIEQSTSDTESIPETVIVGNEFSQGSDTSFRSLSCPSSDSVFSTTPTGHTCHCKHIQSKIQDINGHYLNM